MNRRQFLAVAATSGLVFVLSGCVAVYSTRTVGVRVFDAESQCPVSNATVAVRYSGNQAGDISLAINRPKDVMGVTDTSGYVALKTSSYPGSWDVTAQGYLFNSVANYGNSFHVPKAASMPADRNTAAIFLYREPRPLLNIDVPSNYQGPLRVVATKQLHLKEPLRGCRTFTFQADQKGWCVIPLVEIMEKYHPDIQLRCGGERIYPVVRGEPIRAYQHSMFYGTPKAILWLFTIGAQADYEERETKLWLPVPGMGKQPNLDEFRNLFGFDICSEPPNLLNSENTPQPSRK